MNPLLLIALTTALLFPTPSQSDTNNFGAGGVSELDLSDSEIHLTQKKERQQKLLEEELKKKAKESSVSN